MHDKHSLPWQQFEIMLRAGVPHAIEISEVLHRSWLKVPLPHPATQEVDLEYYCVVHRAYRMQVLPRFLDVMQTLRQSAIWPFIHQNRTAQDWIINQCKNDLNSPVADLASCISESLIKAEFPDSIVDRC